MAERDGVTEQLKAQNQMLWVMRINNIRARVLEIIEHELSYT
ncbi:MAG: TnpV protein [Synergistes jonesii]|nr:TnpV protein [Synergistes jonesii]MDY2983701.1 TnpV protein [Synergistes jonesii]